MAGRAGRERAEGLPPVAITSLSARDNRGYLARSYGIRLCGSKIDYVPCHESCEHQLSYKIIPKSNQAKPCDKEESEYKKNELHEGRLAAGFRPGRSYAHTLFAVPSSRLSLTLKFDWKIEFGLIQRGLSRTATS